MKKIFISHSSQDKQFARMLANHLSEHGLTPWLDESELKVGDRLTKNITDALENADYMAIVLSSNSVQSGWVAKEIEIVRKQEERIKRSIIVPILLEKISIPNELTDRVFADFSDSKAYHKGFHSLLSLFDHHPVFDKNLIIYSDALKIGWENWSWDCECDEQSTEFIHSGQYSVRAKLKAFGGLAFAFRSGVSTKGYSKLEFFLHGGKKGRQKLRVFMNDKLGNGIRQPISIDSPLPNDWCKYSLSLNDLDVENCIIVKINISETSGSDAGEFYLDDMSLVQ